MLVGMGQGYWGSDTLGVRRQLPKEAMMESLSGIGDRDSAASSVAVLRQAWLDAMKSADVERLASLVTDDVVVVHGNGRCVHGKDELKRDFFQAFERFTIEQTVSSAEVVFRGRWAFEIAEVKSTLSPVAGGDAFHVASTTVVALSRQPNGAWKIGRVVGVIDSA